MTTPRTHKVFVYGSLLSGLYNNTVLTHDRVHAGKFSFRLVPMANPGKLLSKTRTVGKFRMYDLGSFPAVTPGGTAPVLGEVWAVTDAGLEALDRLEGYRPGSKDGLYDRREVRLRNWMKAFIYFMHDDDRYVGGDHLVRSGDWRKYDAIKEAAATARRAKADSEAEAVTDSDRWDWVFSNAG